MSGPLEVLDASALLAWLQLEPGADEVELDGSMMNSVNWSEVLQKARQNGVEVKAFGKSSRRSGSSSRLSASKKVRRQLTSTTRPKLTVFPSGGFTEFCVSESEQRYC